MRAERVAAHFAVPTERFSSRFAQDGRLVTFGRGDMEEAYDSEQHGGNKAVSNMFRGHLHGDKVR